MDGVVYAELLGVDLLMVGAALAAGRTLSYVMGELAGSCRYLVPITDRARCRWPGAKGRRVLLVLALPRSAEDVLVVSSK